MPELPKCPCCHIAWDNHPGVLTLCGTVQKLQRLITKYENEIKSMQEQLRAYENLFTHPKTHRI